LGIGAVWTGIEGNKSPLFRKWFSLPAGIEPFAFVPIGIPTETEAPKEKFDPKKIHQERW